MSCQFTEVDGAQSQYPNVTVTFDGSNICVRAIAFQLNNTIMIEQDYPVGTSDMDIAKDLLDQIKGDGGYNSDYEQAQKRSINIGRLLQEAFVGV